MGFKDNVVRGFFAAKKAIKADAPTLEMLAATGFIVAGSLVTAYLADDIAEVSREMKRRKQEIEDVDNDPAGWSEMGETRAHYIGRMIVDGAVGYGKTAGPGLALTATGLGFAWTSKETLENQKTAIAMVAATKAAELTQYRKRVRADAGEAKDQEYLTGVKKRSVIEVQDDGKVIEKTISEPIDLKEDETVMPEHSFWFDESNTEWTKSYDANYNMICGAVRNINLICQKHGYIFENEIRDCFHAERTVQGQYAGAIWDGTPLRVNPVYAERFLNGEDKSALIQIEYADGRPLYDDILKEENRQKLGIKLV